MNTKTNGQHWLAAALAGCGLAFGAQAATTVGSSSYSAYTASCDDLLQTHLGSASSTLSLHVENAGTLATLTDGTAGAAGLEATYDIAGGSVIYTLDTTAHPAGYDLTAIDTYSGWQDTGRVNQHYEVSFRKVGSSTFGDAVTVNYASAIVNETTPVATHVSITDINLTGVDAVQFTFLDQQNGGVGYKELDVFGAASGATYTVNGETSSEAYSVSATDLLQTRLSATDNALSLYSESGVVNGGVAVLTDGAFGPTLSKEPSCGITGGSVTYLLDTAAYPAGYAVTAIDTYAGWVNADRDNQHYRISFRKVGSRFFDDEITVDYASANGQSHVNIANLNLTGVEAIRFTFLSQENDGVGYKELDVTGSPITSMTYTDVTRLSTEPQVIASNDTANVRITEGSGSLSAITLDSAATVINALVQGTTAGLATIDPAGQSLALSTITLQSDAGGLAIGAGSNNGTLKSAGESLFVENASGSDATINSVVADGTGASLLTKSGAGTLMLTGANTYSGGTAVEAGTLKLSSGASLGSGPVKVSGGTLQIDGGTVAPSSGSLFDLQFVDATLNQAGGILSYSGYGQVADATLNLSGGTSGIAADMLLGFGGTNTTVNIGGSHVADWRVTRFYGGTVAVNLLSGGTLYSDHLYSFGAAGTVAFDGGTLGMSSRNSSLSPSDWISASSGSMTLLVNDGGAVIDTANGSAAINRPFLRKGSATGGLTKTGANTLTLACGSSDALSTYTGDTLVQGGTLKLTPVQEVLSLLVNAGFESPALGSAGWGYMSSDGVTGGWTMSEHTTDNGTGIANNGSPWVSVAPEGTQVGYLQQAASIYQTFTVPETAVYRVLFYASNRPNNSAEDLAVQVDDVTMASIAYGTINNNGYFKTYQVDLGTLTAGSHVLKFVGTSPGFDATTAIDNVRISKVSGVLPGPLPTGTCASVSANATLDLNGASQTLAELSGSGIVTNTTGSAAVLTVGGDNGSFTFAGTVQGPVTLVKTGSGTLTLAALNTYTGATVVDGGTLALSPASSGTAIWTTSSSFSFSPATDDLIAGLVPTVSNASEGSEGTGAAATLTDGIVMSTGDKATDYPYSYSIGNNAVLTYVLSAQGQGGNISRINIFSGWADGGRDRITVSSISYSTVSDPSTFVTIPNSAVNYDCTTGDGTTPQNGFASLSAGGGLLALNVYAIRFTFGTQENGWVGYRELEVIGSHSLLPTGTVATVAVGATLDLNGNSQALAGLSGSGTVANGTLAINGTIAPGGTNVVGTLTLNADVSLNGTLLIDTALDGTCDLLQVEGALDVSGLTLQIQDTDQLKAGTRYVIATCTPGALTGKFFSTNLGSKRSVYYDVANGKVMLIGRGLLLSIQ